MCRLNIHFFFGFIQCSFCVALTTGRRKKNIVGFFLLFLFDFLCVYFYAVHGQYGNETAWHIVYYIYIVCACVDPLEIANICKKEIS